MHTIEDTGYEGVPGPLTDRPPWSNDVVRIQAGGGDDETAPEGDPIEADTDGPQRAGSGQPDPLLGFAAKAWTPHAYQERGVTWLASRTAGALFLPPGMGKSSISLAAKLFLSRMGFSSRMLLIAPLTVARTTWLAEPQKWLQFQGLKVGLAHGPDRALVLHDPYWDIVVLNYDGLAWAAPILARGHKFDILLCDEITKLKHTTSKRYKTLKPLLPTFKFRWGLTGTPVANGLLDLFGQMYVLDLGARLGKFITHYRMKYFFQNSWDQYRYQITREKSQELIEKIADIAMYIDPLEWLQLPPLMNVPLEVVLDGEVMKRYKFFEDEFILEMESGNVTAANAGVLTSKLRQFTGGAVYSSPGIWDVVHTTKLDRLKELVEEMAGEPLMVSYQFNHEYERLMKEFPDALAIKGGMTGKSLATIVETWNQGNTAILLVQPAAASLGLNLQFGGSAICWFTMTYNLEEFIQLIARLLRQGQTKPVRNYIITGKGTVDEAVAKVMIKKDAVQNDVFATLKRLAFRDTEQA